MNMPIMYDVFERETSKIIQEIIKAEENSKEYAELCLKLEKFKVDYFQSNIDFYPNKNNKYCKLLEIGLIDSLKNLAQARDIYFDICGEEANM